MNFYQKIRKARENARKLTIDGTLSEEAMEKVLNDVGLGYEICGSTGIPGEQMPFLTVTTEIRIYEICSDDSETQIERYGAVVNMGTLSFEEAARVGAKQCKRLFLACRLGVNVSDQAESIQPFPVQQPVEVNQINQLAAATI